MLTFNQPPMKILRYACLAIAAVATPLAAQTYVPNQTYFGRNDYIEYIAGNLPIIVAAPHGGALTPAELPDRVTTNTTDTNTEDLTRRIRQTVADRFGGYPHIIICRLQRLKLDCNRNIVEGAQGNALTEISWHDYQNFIIAAKQSVTAQYGRGLFLEIHGHGHPAGRLELGYLMDNAELDLDDATLDATNEAANSSIKHLDQISPLTFSQLLRGPASLGGLMAARGYLSVPSPAIPTPGGDEFFEGGHNTVQHGSKTAGTISAIQIECHNAGVRDNATNRQAFAMQLASAVDTYLTDQFTLTPTDSVPTMTALADVTINEDTATNALNFTVDDAVTPAGSLVVEASSSNTTLVPTANIVVTGNAANRSFTVTPAANKFGTATITLKVQDSDQRYALQSFVLTVNAINDPPYVLNVTNQTMNEDTTLGPIAVTVGDVDNLATALVLTATSSNTTLVPNESLAIADLGSTNRSVTVTPAVNRSGTTVVTLTVSDGLLSGTDTFTITVSADSPLTNWQQAQFGPLWTNTAISGDEVDADSDGYTNLVEYGLGGNPNASSATPLFSVQIRSGKLRGTFTRTLANTDITMILQAADSPTGPWTDLVSTINGGSVTIFQPSVTTSATCSGATRTVEVSDMFLATDPAHPYRFMRMKVTR